MSNRFERLGAVRLEAAEGVGQVEAQAFVEPTGDFDVDPPALLGGPLRRVEDFEVAAARDEVGAGLDELGGHLGNARGLVLAVAVERHQAVIAPFEGAGESVPKPRAVAEVRRVAEHLDRRKPPEQLGRPVGRAVVDHQDVSRVPQHFLEDVLQVLLFIMYGDCGENLHQGRCGSRVETDRGKPSKTRGSFMEPTHFRPREWEVNDRGRGEIASALDRIGSRLLA